VLAGDTARTAAEITAEADAAGLPAGQRNGADTCVRYLTSKQEFLRYDQALAVGWPIATGVIKGACRHLIGDRLDSTGARWGLDGTEAILTLRAVISNGDFDEYWHFHLARVHQRLYPGTTQGQYALGARPAPACDEVHDVGIGVQIGQVVHVGHREPAEHQPWRFQKDPHRRPLSEMAMLPAGHRPVLFRRAEPACMITHNCPGTRPWVPQVAPW
jgi:hypothetical protein